RDGPVVRLEGAAEGMLAQFRAERAGPDPRLVEKLLVERVLACWLQVGYADVAATQQSSQVIFHLAAARRQESSQRRDLQGSRQVGAGRRILGAPGSPVAVGVKTRWRRRRWGEGRGGRGGQGGGGAAAPARRPPARPSLPRRAGGGGARRDGARRGKNRGGEGEDPPLRRPHRRHPRRSIMPAVRSRRITRS